MGPLRGGAGVPARRATTEGRSRSRSWAATSATPPPASERRCSPRSPRRCVRATASSSRSTCRSRHAVFDTCYNDPPDRSAFARFRLNHLTHLNRRFDGDFVLHALLPAGALQHRDGRRSRDTSTRPRTRRSPSAPSGWSSICGAAPRSTSGSPPSSTATLSSPRSSRSASRSTASGSTPRGNTECFYSPVPDPPSGDRSRGRARSSGQELRVQRGSWAVLELAAPVVLDVLRTVVDQQPVGCRKLARVRDLRRFVMTASR